MYYLLDGCEERFLLSLSLSFPLGFALSIAMFRNYHAKKNLHIWNKCVCVFFYCFGCRSCRHRSSSLSSPLFAEPSKIYVRHDDFSSLLLYLEFGKCKYILRKDHRFILFASSSSRAFYSLLHCCRSPVFAAHGPVYAILRVSHRHFLPFVTIQRCAACIRMFC